MANTEILHQVKTGDIRVGDIVRAYGMRIRINTIKWHEDPNAYGGQFWSTDGTVLNLDEVREAQRVPLSWLKTEKFVEGSGWVTDRTDYWNVQGSNLATWTVERTEA